MSRLDGGALRLSIIAKTVNHRDYDIHMLLELFEFCFEQLCFRSNSNEISTMLDECRASFRNQPAEGRRP